MGTSFKEITSFGFFRLKVRGLIGFGNILNDLFTEDSSINSEKIISTTLLLTFTEPLDGIILITRGAITSFGPPDGAFTAAQDKKVKTQNKWNNVKSTFILDLIFLDMDRKLFAEYHLICS